MAGKFYVVVVQAVLLFGCGTWVLTPPVGEIPRGVTPPGGAVYGSHGPQTSVVQDMGVPTHWGGAINGGTGGDWGIYRLLPEHGCAIHSDPSYHGLVSSSGAEVGNAPVQAMVGASCPGYHRDRVGEDSRRGGGTPMSCTTDVWGP